MLQKCQTKTYRCSLHTIEYLSHVNLRIIRSRQTAFLNVSNFLNVSRQDNGEKRMQAGKRFYIRNPYLCCTI